MMLLVVPTVVSFFQYFLFFASYWFSLRWTQLCVPIPPPPPAPCIPNFPSRLDCCTYHGRNGISAGGRIVLFLFYFYFILFLFSEHVLYCHLRWVVALSLPCDTHLSFSPYRSLFSPKAFVSTYRLNCSKSAINSILRSIIMILLKKINQK